MPHPLLWASGHSAELKDLGRQPIWINWLVYIVIIWLLYVIIWLMLVNNNYLLGGAIITILENDELRQWGWDDIPLILWKIKHV